MKNGRINKSEWIRQQPLSLSAKEVVAKAAKEGIELTPAQVYTTRSVAKKDTVPEPMPVLEQTPAEPLEETNGNQPSSDLRQQFACLVRRLGIDQATKLVDEVASKYLVG